MSGSLVRLVPFAATEEALKLLHSTHADFGRLPASGGRGRLRSSGAGVLGGYDFVQVRAQSEYLRLVSIVEAFIDSTAGELFEVKTRGLDTLVALMTAVVVEQASNSWEERKNAFNRYHGVVLGNCAKYSDIDAAVVVRNAIAHGLGGLTRRQRNGKDQGKVASMGVALHGHHLIIDQAALNRCVRSCAAFIADVDSRIPR